MCGKAPIDQVLKLPGIVYSFLAPMSADDISDCFESEKLFSTSNAHADPCNLNLCSSKLKQFGDWNVALDLRRTCTQIWLLWRTRFRFCFCFFLFYHCSTSVTFIDLLFILIFEVNIYLAYFLMFVTTIGPSQKFICSGEICLLCYSFTN